MANASAGKRADVGGIGGEVRARTQEEVWTKFEKQVRPEVEERFGLFLEAPQTREAAYERMWQDPKSEWWVLDYYFSK
jgi:hypothetical protein